MPDHIKFILRHAFYGFLIACTFTGMVLYFNIANIWHLVTHTTEGPIALAVFVILCTITFGSVQIGMQIMTMGEEDDDADGGKRDDLPVLDDMTALKQVPIPIHADDRR